MALSSLAPMTRLVAILQAIPGVQTVYIGIPSGISTPGAAFVALGGQELVTEATQIMQRRARYFVAFVYSVASAPATAEPAIAGFIDAFQAALLVERTTGMNSGSGPIVDSVEWDFSLGDRPDYQPIASREFRVWPCLITVTQHADYG